MTDVDTAARRSDPTTPAEAINPGRISDRFAYALVALSVAFGLWTLRAERLSVAYPNDSSVHSLSVQYARMQWSSGHFPLDGWFPYLSLGSPFFLHYQSTPAVLTGALALLIGSDHAFSWTLYLLLASWPISVYFSARLFRLTRWQGAAAAAVAPLLMSMTGYGYEHQAYDWIGNGLWPQLFGMWMLPLAWGFSWQAVSRGRHRFAAVAALAATIAFHFLTAYLAGLALILFVVLRPTEILRRLGRGAIVSIGALAATLWITIPIVVDTKWGAINESQVGTYWDNSYGARQILTWLIEGKLYDEGRTIPVVTTLVGVGLAVCIVRFRRDERARALLGLWVLSMLLYFGRPTLGFALNHLPGQANLFFQRFNTGVDLSGIILAGVGLCALGELALFLPHRYGRRIVEAVPRWTTAFAVPLIAAIAIIVLLAPAWTQINTRGYDDAAFVGFQRAVDSTEGAELNSLLAIVKSANNGRVYAGLPSNWGATFRVDQIPVYIYLTDEGVDEVGFTLRTSSLMTNPEVHFDDANAGDFSLFGIHYIIVPSGDVPDVPSTLVQKSGPFALWSVGTGGYFEVVDTQGSIAANNADLGKKSAALLQSKLPGEQLLPTIAYAGAPAPTPTLGSTDVQSGSPGYVIASSADLTEGQANAVVHANRTAVALLSASFDPGWTVTVNGVPARTEMIAPALVGVQVGPGVSTVVFRYQAYKYYPELFAIGGAAILIAALMLTGLGQRFWRRRSGEMPTE